MAKPLRDIAPKGHFKEDEKLKGVSKSSTRKGSTGTDPGVDYMPKREIGQKFVAAHETEEHEDRVGNKKGVYDSGDVKYSLDAPINKLRGRTEKESKAVYEARAIDKADAQCNMSEEGKMCPVHGLKECSSMKMIKEKAPKKLEEITKKVKEDLAMPMLEDGKKKKKKVENEQADVPVTYGSGTSQGRV